MTDLNASDFSNLLKSVNAGSAVSKLEAAASAVRGLVSAPVETVAESAEAIANSFEETIEGLKTDLAAAADLIERLLADNDKILPQMLDVATASIYDYTTAEDAASEYNRRWFQRALLSENTKVQFAAHLFELIKRYSRANLDTLRLIATRDPDVLDSIRFPVDDE